MLEHLAHPSMAFKTLQNFGGNGSLTLDFKGCLSPVESHRTQAENICMRTSVWAGPMQTAPSRAMPSKALGMGLPKTHRESKAVHEWI